MTKRVFSRWVLGAAWAGAVVAGGPGAARAAEAGKACALLTPSELEAVLGAKVSLSGGGVPAGLGVDLCTGRTPTATVLLRVAKGSGGSGGAEAAGIEMARKMGAQVDVKTFGAITCSTMVPPASLAEHGFNTTCAVNKAGAVAAIEVTARSQKDMIPIERLRPLAEKMAGRFQAGP
jgi:hypothetical protein